MAGAVNCNIFPVSIMHINTCDSGAHSSTTICFVAWYEQQESFSAGKVNTIGTTRSPALSYRCMLHLLHVYICGVNIGSKRCSDKLPGLS